MEGRDLRKDGASGNLAQGLGVRVEASAQARARMQHVEKRRRGALDPLEWDMHQPTGFHSETQCRQLLTAIGARHL